MAKAKRARVESTLTDRYQTTVPSTVRDVLGLKKRDKISFTIEGDRVVLSRAQQQEDDPALGAFLGFLERDIKAHPQRVGAVTPGLVDRARSLVAGVEVDLDKSLPSEDE